MKLRTNWLFLTVFIALAIPMLAMAQQVYHGDGATPGGSSVLQWQFSSAGSGQCLYCHRPGGIGTDKSSYLMSGHKNMVRKVSGTPPLNLPWSKADGTAYGTSYATMSPPGMWTDPGNLSATFDWSTGLVTYGTGSTAPLFYIVDAWMDPTQMNSIFSGGFTGELPGDYGVPFPGGTYMCARCHVTGYQFDDSGPEPTYNGTKIPDTQFSRIPTVFSVVSSAGTITCSDSTNTHCISSWHLDAIQCERCHNADNGINNHTASGAIAGGIPTKPTSAAATAVCIECHRQETASTGSCSDGVSTNPGDCTAGSGTWTDNQSITMTTDLMISGAAKPCSDGVSLDQASCAASTACTGSAGGCTWTFWGPATALDGPGLFFDTNPGQTFLNSPHARFTGTLTQNAQISSDLSVVVTGMYNSKFQPGGCTTCHDVHQSTVAAVGAAPMKKKCTDCHTEKLSGIKHPSGSGTPLDVTDPADACVTCHMVSGTTGKYHLVRISVDPNYSTFPTPAQYYNTPQTIANTAPDGSFTSAVWNDLDIACGQCHGGSNPTPQAGISYFDKLTLAGKAGCIHSDSAVTSVTAGSGPNGSITPSGNQAVSAGSNITFTIAANPGYLVQSVIVNGASVGPVTSYTMSNITGCNNIIAYFKLITYTITATAGTGGSISPPGVNTVNAGGDLTFTITPSAGYTTAHVYVDGADQGSVGTVPFNNVSSNHTISATFAANTSYTITASAGANGTITPGTVSLLGGANQKFTFSPQAGYRVSTVTVDGSPLSSAPSSYTFYNVQGPHSINVTFVSNTYNVSISAIGGGSVQVTGTAVTPTLPITVSGGQTDPITVNPGSSLTITVTAGTDRSVWDYNASTNTTSAKYNVTSYSLTNIKADHTITVYFK